MPALLGLIRRGALAGLIGGVVAGTFGVLLAEPLIDRAVRREAARSVGTAGTETFSRATQHAGLLVSSAATGAALGVLFGVLYAVVHRSDGLTAAWPRAVQLGAASFFALYLVPFVRYPANPPGVGDPDTLSRRTTAYLMALVVGVVGAAVAAQTAAALRRRAVRTSLRQLAVAGVLVLAVVIPFTFPADADRLDVPPGLLWDFRLFAFATALLLWGGLTAAFGLLGERAARPALHPLLTGNR